MLIDDGADSEQSSRRFLSGWHYRTAVWSVVLSIAAYMGFVFWTGWSEVSEAIRRVGLAGVCAALILSLVNYGLRFVRWQCYMRAMGHPVPWWPSLRMYIAGFALTTTPGKTGEALRGVLYKRWGVPYPNSFAALLSERMADLLAVLLLALLGLSLYPQLRSIVAISALAVLGAFAALSSKRLLEILDHWGVSSGRWRPLLHNVARVLMQARRCHALPTLPTAMALSIIAWAAEAWAFDLILVWMGVDISTQLAVFIYAISILAGALSFMPGGLGGTEATMTGLLVWSGADLGDAVGATVLVRLATLWFAVLLGAVALSASKK